MMRRLGCLLDGHIWRPISDQPLAGKVRSQCEKCRAVRVVRAR